MVTLTSKAAEIDALLDCVVTAGRLEDLLEAVANGAARRRLHADEFELLVERIDEMRVRWRMDAGTCRN